MPAVRTNNVERSKCRKQCREQLSQYIRETDARLHKMVTDYTLESTLGIAIDPSQVRLVPRVTDPYRWRFVPEKEHLFSKNISEHSIGAYKELCEGIDAYNEGKGAAFEAVPAPSVKIADFNSPKGAINIVRMLRSFQ